MYCNPKYYNIFKMIIVSEWLQTQWWWLCWEWWPEWLVSCNTWSCCWFCCVPAGKCRSWKICRHSFSDGHQSQFPLSSQFSHSSLFYYQLPTILFIYKVGFFHNWASISLFSIYPLPINIYFIIIIIIVADDYPGGQWPWPTWALAKHFLSCMTS